MAGGFSDAEEVSLKGEEMGIGNRGRLWGFF